MTCPEIKKDRLFYNFLLVEDNTQAFTVTDVLNVKKDVIGNEMGEYSFAIIDFRSMGNLPISFSSEDIDSAADISKINSWLISQAEGRLFPNYGDNITVEELIVPPLPTFAGSTQSAGINLAKHMIQVVIKYYRTIN